MRELVLEPSTLLLWQYGIWSLILLVGGVIARRDLVYGIVTALVAAPCMLIGIPVAIFCVALLIALPLSLLGLDFAKSETMEAIVFLVGHTLAFIFWLLWVRLTRENSGNKFGPGQTTSSRKATSGNAFTLRRK